MQTKISLVENSIRAAALSVLSLTSATVQAQSWKLIGITGQQGDTATNAQGAFTYPDHTLFDMDPVLAAPGTGAPLKLFQVPFVNDSQAIGYNPDDGLIYHTGGSQSYSNNPLRTGHDQGGPDIFGVGYQDSQYMETIDLQSRAFRAIFNAAPCPNPDPTLPCFGLPAPRPDWVLPGEQRNSNQTGGEYRARGPNEYHAIRGLAWSAAEKAFFAADEEGIFKITPAGASTFIARPAFPTGGGNNEAKSILVTRERLLIGHRNGVGGTGYLMEVDAETGAVLREVILKYPRDGGAPVDGFGGLLGLAQHPQTKVIYGVRKTSDHFARELVTINHRTGDTVLVGNLGMHIASIAFAASHFPASPWKLVGITGQQGDTATNAQGGFTYPDHTLFDLDPVLTAPGIGIPLKLFQVPFVNDGQAIGYNPDDGLLYHTGGSQSYSNNPLRTGHDQGGPDIFGVGFQDSQFMETINLQTRAFRGIFNAAPCPNPDPTLPCFGLPAPRPGWLLPEDQRNSNQTGNEYRARGPNEYHTIRGLAWSAARQAFYAADEEGIFRITPGGDSTFIARPAFPTGGGNNESKAILVSPETLLIGHRNGVGGTGYLMEVDANTGDVLGEIALKYPPGGGAPVDAFGGLLGLAQHPRTKVIYGVRQTSDHFARELVTIDSQTGDTALVGNLGMHIASIAFAEPSPMKIQTITRSGNNVTITWTGGSPPYQL